MESNENIPSQYRPLSPWAYLGYNLLFVLPIIGFIFLIIFAFDNSNLNRRNYSRSLIYISLYSYSFGDKYFKVMKKVETKNVFYFFCFDILSSS